MSKPKQKVVATATPSGIEVTCEPLDFSSIDSASVDSTGMRHFGFSTEEELRAAANIPDDYDTVSFNANSWVQQDGEGAFLAHQCKGTFRPPHPGKSAIEKLLDELKTVSPIIPLRFPKDIPGRRMLEISIVDPHIGMQCFRNGADEDYNLTIARYRYLGAVQRLVKAAEVYGPFEQILFPFGNDYLHAEPMNAGKGSGNATTSGTLQPEMMDWYEAYEFGERLLRETLSYLSEVAPVEALQIPGNHDSISSFTIGRVMAAYFHNDANVNVDASPSSYKFKEYGCNLIGFEHGHSIAPIRLASLMANECPDAWARTKGGYREWHLGDQHRKGSAKPSMLEEQGVSVEYLPSLVAPNTWHREKSFNWQKRGAMAWVWDREAGPVARLQVNLNSVTGDFRDVA
jgi:hypothetical protein